MEPSENGVELIGAKYKWGGVKMGPSENRVESNGAEKK